MTKGLLTSIVFGGISVGVGYYCYAWASASVDIYAKILPEIEVNSKLYLNTLSSWREALEKEITLVLITMLSGSAGLLGGVYYGVKYRRWKKWLGWLSSILSLAGLMYGLICMNHYLVRYHNNTPEYNSVTK